MFATVTIAILITIVITVAIAIPNYLLVGACYHCYVPCYCDLIRNLALILILTVIVIVIFVLLLLQILYSCYYCYLYEYCSVLFFYLVLSYILSNICLVVVYDIVYKRP